VAHDDVHYVFVSSISVYSDPSRPSDETSAVHPLTGHEDGEVLNLDSYGRLKVACERAVDQVLPGRAQHIRAGLILGPHDYDERFAWWLRRLARGGEVLAPGRPDAPVQVIDARDLAAWMVLTAERRERGVFNATGPATPLALGDVLATTAATSGSSARLVWASDALLQAHGVSPLCDLPFWIPAAYAELFRTRIERALATGLRFRPFADTARDTWRWLQTRWDREAGVRQHRSIRVPAGIDPEREARILAQVPR
jgi:2'-hydroxyisoflavone reductase